MLFVSAAIVFVNRVEDFGKTNAALKTDLAAKQREATDAQSALPTERSGGESVRNQLGGEISRLRQTNNDALAQIRQRDAALATAQQNFASESARLQSATAALDTAQKTNA